MIKRPPTNLPWVLQVQECERHGTLYPIEGWPLVPIADLEVARPGFLLHVLRAGPRWRQSFYIFLSVVGLDRAAEFVFRATGSEIDRPWAEVLREAGSALQAMSPKAILATCLPEIPDGLMGSLVKLGMRPMPSAGDYERLIALLRRDDEESRERAKTLLQLSRLDADILKTVLIIDRVALIPDLISRMGHSDRAKRLNEALVPLRLMADATDEALHQSLKERSNGFRLQEFVQGWLCKIRALPPSCAAMEDHPHFERVVPATAESVGRRFGNCLSTKLIDLLGGVWTAWVWKTDDLIVCLTAVETGYLLTGIHGHDNFDPPAEQASEVRRVLASLGVICLNRVAVADEVLPLYLRRGDGFGLEELEFA